MNRVTDTYAAGFFDADGCVTITTGKHESGSTSYHILAGISNTNREILEWHKEKYGGVIYHIYRAGKGKNHKDLFQWRISARQAIKFLKRVYPYLIVKKERADVAFEMDKRLALTRGKPFKLSNEELAIRAEIRQRMREYNLKGIKGFYS